ncbi:MAG: hypothetical protein L0312_30835 [Acidobacteria bacterium]|nr:hypothetical protein [Acidobacteriota bacterium]
MRALKAFVAFLREVLSENGVGSLSRTASAVLVAGYTYVMVSTRSVPEHTEQLAWVLAALYGANQLKGLGQTFTQTLRRTKK